MLNNNEGICELCKSPCTQKCSQCKLVYYCSNDHQKENWKDHKPNCKNYEISNNSELGRFLIAKRDLEQDELIFLDNPLVFGSKPYKIEEGFLSCVGCSKLLTNVVFACSGCGWPACNPECESLKNLNIHGLECQILKLSSKPSHQEPYEYFRADTLIILRALLLQKTNKKKWDNLLNLQDHLNKRGPNTEIFKIIQEKMHFIQENFVKPLKIYEHETGQNILPVVSQEIIHKIYGILDINAIEISDPELSILYPIASLIEHNCIPNAHQIIDEKNGYKVTYRAALPIKQGEHITIAYTNILWGTQERQKYLKETKYFTCNCKRCNDPTELGTYFSALICMGTEKNPCKGIQLPFILHKESLSNDENTLWICNKCGIKLPNKDITGFINHLNDEVNKEIDKNPKMEELEEFLNKLEVFLHPNHFLVFTIRHSLVQLYKTDGEFEISNEFLEQKLKMCEEMIEIVRKLDPGNSRLALYLAVLLNEQFNGKFKMLTRNFQAEEKNLHHKDLINNISKIIIDSINSLKYEQNQSESGKKLMSVVQLNEIKFQTWIKQNNCNF